jgi:catechol 2,3-dioxygenase-like lactoylglutathione lyase family enzyme
MDLNQVTLPARNIQESIEFYRRMGFLPIVEAEHYVRFECPQGESTFSIHQVESCDGNHGCVIYFETENLDQRVRQLQDGGFCFYQQPQDEPWLWREARLNDPSGNIICLYWAGENRKNPPWRVKP